MRQEEFISMRFLECSTSTGMSTRLCLIAALSRGSHDMDVRSYIRRILLCCILYMDILPVYCECIVCMCIDCTTSSFYIRIVFGVRMRVSG